MTTRNKNNWDHGPKKSTQLPKAPWSKVPKTPSPVQRPVKKGKKGK